MRWSLRGTCCSACQKRCREYDDWFSPVDRRIKIYAKVGASMPGGYHLPMHRTKTTNEVQSPPSFQDRIWSELELQRAGDRVLLARFGPPGLIIDEHLNVLQARGQTSPYVELASGVVSWKLMRVVRDGLASAVREAAEHAISDNVPVSRSALLTDPDGEVRRILVEVLPLSHRTSSNRSYIILFLDGAEPKQVSQTVEQPLLSTLSADEKDRVVAQLRQDLSSTRFHLQSLIEERDARNQELVSANEEIQSANEELQSTNRRAGNHQGRAAKRQ